MEHTVKQNSEQPDKRTKMSNTNKNEPVTEFTIIPNGPIKVTGNFIIKDAKDQVIETDCEVLLCRCGATSNQPFCDRSHIKVGLLD